VNLKTFELPYGNHLLKGDLYASAQVDCSTIILHGAGKSSRTTFSRLRYHLCLNGFSSVGFDFVGHGETGGEIQETTLRGRTEQAAEVIKHKCQGPLTLIGASMGAYSAVKLTEHFEVENLILLVPAVYTPRAYEVPFGPRFSAMIREPESWADSDAFDTLSNFAGSIIIIAAEFDDVIPSKLIDQLYASTIRAKKRNLHVVPDSRHLSLFPQEKDFHEAMDLLLAVLEDRKGL